MTSEVDNLHVPASGRPVVVACLGDSITRGIGTHNWIEELKGRPQNRRFEFLNFGVDGDLTYSALQRLQPVIDADPDVVIVALGWNDITTLVLDNVRKLISRQKRLPRDPSPEWFRENLDSVVGRLRSGTKARIALVSPCQMGEAPDSDDPVQQESNLRYAEYSEYIKRAADRYEASYLPFYETMHALLVDAPGQAAGGFKFGSYYAVLARHYLLGRSLDEIGEQNGWRYHTDGLHLSRRGGMILAELVQNYLDQGDRT